MISTLEEGPMTKRGKHAEEEGAAKPVGRTNLKVTQEFLRMVNAVSDFAGMGQSQWVDDVLLPFVEEKYQQMIRKESERLRGD